MAAKKLKGKITEWYGEKEYGYLTPETGGMRVKFLSADTRKIGFKPTIGQEVLFRLSQDEQGNHKATKIERMRHFYVSIIVAVWFVITLAMCVWLFAYPLVIIYYYSFISLIVMFVSWLDKRALQKGTPSTSEASYFFLSMLGGWIAESLCHYFMRLKAKSLFYRIFFSLCILVHIGFLLWSLSPYAEQPLSAVDQAFYNQVLNYF
ncbi:DUF1294 domain-containing protein [Vibrio sp. TRT 17S01]|uniref:DUF1294 domain-containing protein n=1 Tax=Vibrio sp. TRT 17S01 TaxID=3418505 RepID=UPI003CE830FC